MKTTKRALFSSVMALILCFSMLVGTTFAWFTDSVESGVNQIIAGNLDVEVYYGDPAAKASIQDITTLFDDVNGQPILWEPGAVAFEKLTVANEGTLALKYQMAINFTNENEINGTGAKLSQILKIAVVDAGALTSREAALAAAKTAPDAATLHDFVLSGELAATTQNTYGIVIWWEPSANDNNWNVNNGKTTSDSEKFLHIDLGIKLVATQLDAEFDSFGPDYDEDAWHKEFQVSTADDLNDALANVQDGDVIKFASDITFTSETVGYNDGTYVDGIRYTGDKSFTIDLNGHTIIDDGCVNDYLLYLNNKGEKANEITLKNGAIVSKSGCWATVCVNSAASTQATVLNLEGMKITNSNDAAYSGNLAVRARDKATVNVNKDTVITSDGASYGIAANTSDAIVNINDGATVIQKNSGTTGGNSVFAAVGGKGVININAGATIESDKYGVHTMTTGTPVVNVKGGTITGDVALKASTNGGTGELATINVTGGIINGKLETYTSNGHIVVSGGTFTVAPSAYVASGYYALWAGSMYFVVPDGISNVVTSLTELQAALDAATGDTLIVFAADINGDVIVSQKEGVNIVIDGANYKYDGTIYVYGNSRNTGAETLTIKNVNFITTSEVTRDFIHSYGDNKLTEQRYAHNVTIEDCTFTNENGGTVVAARFRQAYNITMKNCTVKGTFSPMWTTGVQGLTIQNVTADCANEGMTIGASNDVLIENCTITVPGADSFGIRTDATADYKLTVNNCTLKVATPIVIRGSSDTYTVIVDGGKYVSTTQELINAIKNAPVGEVTTIVMANGTYAGDIDITVAAFSQSGGDVVIKAMKGAKPVITGTVTLGLFVNKTTKVAKYDANVTFEGITFDHAEVLKHSLDVQNVKSLNLINCTVIGDGEYGIGSASGNPVGASKIIGCTFVNAGLQISGNFGGTTTTNLLIDNCTFNESVINVQGGYGVTVQKSNFTNTVTDANNNESFYVIRSQAIPITVTGCTFNVDSTVTGTGVAGAKGWGVFVNRNSANWTVSDVKITMTEAAMAQDALVVAKCLSTGKINMTNVTVNGVPQ